MSDNLPLSVIIYMLSLLLGALISSFYENPYFLALFGIALIVKQLGRINTTLRKIYYGL